MLGLTDIATEAVFSTAAPLVHTKASDENEMKVNWANLSLALFYATLQCLIQLQLAHPHR